MEKKRFILDGTNNRAVDEERIKQLTYISSTTKWRRLN